MVYILTPIFTPNKLGNVGTTYYAQLRKSLEIRGFWDVVIQADTAFDKFKSRFQHHIKSLENTAFSGFFSCVKIRFTPNFTPNRILTPFLPLLQHRRV